MSAKKLSRMMTLGSVLQGLMALPWTAALFGPLL